MRSMNKLALMAYLAIEQSKQESRHPLIDTKTPLVPMKDYKPPDDFKNDPNYYYPSEYRILNGWECFQAQGKICMEEGHNSLYYYTKSSDPGNVFCCKPDNNKGLCENGSKHDHPG